MWENFNSNSAYQNLLNDWTTAVAMNPLVGIPEIKILQSKPFTEYLI